MLLNELNTFRLHLIRRTNQNVMNTTIILVIYDIAKLSFETQRINWKKRKVGQNKNKII